MSRVSMPRHGINTPDINALGIKAPVTNLSRLKPPGDESRWDEIPQIQVLAITVAPR